MSDAERDWKLTRKQSAARLAALAQIPMFDDVETTDG